MEICQLCQKETTSLRGLGMHICLSHKKEMTVKEYYDIFILIQGDNKCKNSKCDNLLTHFTGLELNYTRCRYCSISCARSSEEVQNKQRQTCLDRYNDPNYRNTEQYVQTCLDKYDAPNALSKNTTPYLLRNQTVKAMGVDNVFQLPEVIEKVRKANVEQGRWIDTSDPEKHKEYDDYYKIVQSLSRTKRKELFKNWDGKDFYDDEYIKDNSINLESNDMQYPTVDHLNSVVYCFLNGISATECASLKNMVITKRIHNATKGDKTYEEYLEWLSIQK
jgi:hypothetical protein